MDFRELQFFTEQEQLLPDATALPAAYLLKCLFMKICRRLLPGQGGRLVWTVTAVSDASGPAANVRNYLEQKTLRQILTEIAPKQKLARAWEIGCGYGRIIMVLREFADYVKGFEREGHLVNIARTLLPDIDFQCVAALTEISAEEPYDFVFTCTVLQHLTDEEARRVCDVMKRLAPLGHILLIEKVEPLEITANVADGTKFISRGRTVDTYGDYLSPFKLVMSRERIVEPTHANPRPGQCLLFASPHLQEN